MKHQLTCWLRGNHDWLYLWTTAGTAVFKCQRCQLRRSRTVARQRA